MPELSLWQVQYALMSEVVVVAVVVVATMCHGCSPASCPSAPSLTVCRLASHGVSGACSLSPSLPLPRSMLFTFTLSLASSTLSHFLCISLLCPLAHTQHVHPPCHAHRYMDLASSQGTPPVVLQCTPDVVSQMAEPRQVRRRAQAMGISLGVRASHQHRLHTTLL